MMVLLFGSATMHKDPIITYNAKSYKVWYDVEKHVPVLVVWKMSKSGGDCSRTQMIFKAGAGTATRKDYWGSNYDQGHMVSAEDFAYDCNLMSETFSYYNCAPQTPELNRGIWKTYENKTRATVKNDSVLVACGTIYRKVKIKQIGTISIPTSYWKVVQSLKTGQIYFAGTFTNTKHAKLNMVDTTYLQKISAVRIPFKKFK